MPRRKRPSYGVQKKYKRKRCSKSENVEDVELNASSDSVDLLNEAFCCDTSALGDITDHDEQYMTMTFPVMESIGTQVCPEVCDHGIQEKPEMNEKETQVYGDCDLHVTFVEDDSCFVGNFDVPTKYQDIKSQLLNLPKPFLLNQHADKIEILAVSDTEGKVYTSLKVLIDENGFANIFVHNKLVPRNHRIWDLCPKLFSSQHDIVKLLENLLSFKVCIGNPDEDLVSLIPVGAGISCAPDPTIIAYREENFNASLGNVVYSSTIRSADCCLLVEGQRCTHCSKYRRALKQRKDRQENLLKKDIDFTKSTYKNSDMPRCILLKKLEQQREQISSLQDQVAKLERKLKRKISSEGVTLDKVQDLEMRDLMASCEQDVMKAFPDANSYQRLFWSQQLKSIETSKFGMRWHPMIIRWCLSIRQKSQKAYDAIRDAGFITLPSNRTLFDYSHYIRSDLGFNADVLKMLKEEAEKLDMYKEEWRKYVGVLFDEIRIKEDLVYNKVSGELIGYCNLDSVGNTLMNIENEMANKENSVAKYVLVLMVRGVTTSLKFPLAAFATQSISADFLYPIVWTAISLLEVHLKLPVLFLTCDGASANRKFFSIHRLPGFDNINFSENPFDRNRKIFFISDVPHLLKTARNCFSNSFSHKCTRQLWRNGKDISWMHIVKLFEEHCEFNMYNPCPKITRNHIDLNAFSYMKVNLAAQVLSDSVANALEEYYGQHVSETILFIRHMNKFFDILNVRSLVEGRNKRNSDLNPFKSIEDERLDWLTGDFVKYFEDWAENVSLRDGEFSSRQKAGMMLSHQTVTGLKISVKSITECVKFILNKGADFVLTSAFNQDPLEQHFGHYRQKGGSNRNPTVNEVRHILTNIRTVGAQAIPSQRGNTEVRLELPPIDHTKLPKRQFFS